MYLVNLSVTSWMWHKVILSELKDGNYTTLRQHPTKQQQYDHLPPFTKTIKVRRTRNAEHSWRSKDELISDVLLWTPSHGGAKAGRPARTYIQQLCADTRCSPEDLLEAMDDREGWWERVRDIRADGVTWWWWWWKLVWIQSFSSSWLCCISIIHIHLHVYI